MQINNLKSRKGVSPLIATILLIAFAVALGSVVLNWSLNIGIDSKDKCNDLEIKLRNINTAEVCFGGLNQNRRASFIMDNKGENDISGLVMLVIGNKGTKIFEFNDIIMKKKSSSNKIIKNLDYDLSALGPIKEVQFIPKIPSEDGSDICSKSAIKTEKIDNC